MTSAFLNILVNLLKVINLKICADKPAKILKVEEDKKGK